MHLKPRPQTRFMALGCFPSQAHGVDVITGFSSEYGYVEAADSGASDFIVKPIHIHYHPIGLRTILPPATLEARRRVSRESVAGVPRRLILSKYSYLFFPPCLKRSGW